MRAANQYVSERAQVSNRHGDSRTDQKIAFDEVGRICGANLARSRKHLTNGKALRAVVSVDIAHHRDPAVELHLAGCFPTVGASTANRGEIGVEVGIAHEGADPRERWSRSLSFCLRLRPSQHRSLEQSQQEKSGSSHEDITLPYLRERANSQSETKLHTPCDWLLFRNPRSELEHNAGGNAHIVFGGPEIMGCDVISLEPPRDRTNDFVVEAATDRKGVGSVAGLPEAGGY
jgi:hypothetical protein